MSEKIFDNDKEYEAFLRKHPVAMRYLSRERAKEKEKPGSSDVLGMKTEELLPILDKVVQEHLKDSSVRYKIEKSTEKKTDGTNYTIVTDVNDKRNGFIPAGNHVSGGEGEIIPLRNLWEGDNMQQPFAGDTAETKLNTALKEAAAYNPDLLKMLNETVEQAKKNTDKSIKDGYMDDLQKAYEFRDEMLTTLASLYRTDGKAPDLNKEDDGQPKESVIAKHLEKINKKYGTDFSLDVLKKRGNETNEISPYAFTLVKNPNERNNPYEHKSLKEIPLESRYGPASLSDNQKQSDSPNSIPNFYNVIMGKDKPAVANEKEASAVEKQDEKTVSSAGQQAEIGARIAAARERIGLKFDGTDKFSPNPANIAQTDRRLAEYMAISGRT